MSLIEKMTVLQMHIAEKLADQNLGFHFDQDELVVLTPAASLKKTVKFLRDDKKCQFKQLMDVTAADYPNHPERFEVIYNFLSIALNQRIRIKVKLADEKPIDSITSYFSAAGWFEREVWDMYGISFKGNTDLRRILTDYGFDGHPLRKDFPLTGFIEMRYDETEQRCVYEPVQLQQDFRNFEFTSPWDGMTKVMLPGDEKAVKPKFMPEDKE